MIPTGSCSVQFHECFNHKALSCQHSLRGLLHGNESKRTKLASTRLSLMLAIDACCRLLSLMHLQAIHCTTTFPTSFSTLTFHQLYPPSSLSRHLLPLIHKLHYLPAKPSSSCHASQGKRKEAYARLLFIRGFFLFPKCPYNQATT